MSDASLELKRHLLALLGGSATPSLTPSEWDAVEPMVHQHRLAPLLAWRLEQAGPGVGATVPLADSWRSLLNEARLANLASLAALRSCAHRLERAGIQFVVLKGPRLAWRCYPEGAHRPMRDLDLLVQDGDSLRAAEALGQAGFRFAHSDAVLTEALTRDKHLPPLRHPGLNATVEVHHRLTDPPAQRGYHIPQLSTADVLARREVVELSGISVPCQTPTDLLAHIMVHGLYGHRLDCGPLVLADIHFLLASESVDPAAFRSMAESGGWHRGAALLLALTERYFGPQPLTLGGAPPEAMLAAAEEALLQDLAARDHSVALSDLFASSSASAFAGAVTRRLRPDKHILEAEGGGRPMWRFWPVWALRRLGRLASRLRDPRTRREAGQAAALLRWLQG